MKLTVIGYYGGAAPANEACTAYLLEHDQHFMLLDCGPGAMSLLQNYIDVSAIEMVLLSHYHFDHYSDLGALLYHRLIRNQLTKQIHPLTLYAPHHDAFNDIYHLEGVNHLHNIDEDTIVQWHGLTITFMRTRHPVYCLAMRLETKEETLVFTADSAYDESLALFCEGSDLLITECSLYPGFDGTKSGHMNADDVCRLIQTSGCQKVILSHLPIYGKHVDLVDTIRKRTECTVIKAEKGASYTL